MVAVPNKPIELKQTMPAARLYVGAGYKAALVDEFRRLYDYEGATGDLSKHLTLQMISTPENKLSFLTVVPNDTLKIPAV